MVGKTICNGDALASLRYVARGGSIRLGGNMLGQSPQELAAEFGLIHALRPSIRKPVIHLVGAFAPKDRLTDQQMYEIALQFIEAQGYQDSLYTVWRHLDGTTDHFHVVTSQVDTEGRAIDRSFERYRTKRTCRRLEKEFGLQVVANVRTKDRDVLTPAPSAPVIDGLDIDLPSVTTVVQDALAREIRESMPGCTTVGDLAQRLHLKGIAMVPQIHAVSGQVYGMGYRIEHGPLAGSYMAGSKVPGN